MGDTSLDSEVQALSMSCFNLPMSTDSFVVMSLQIHLGVCVNLFNAQNVCMCPRLLSELTLLKAVLL